LFNAQHFVIPEPDIPLHPAENPMSQYWKRQSGFLASTLPWALWLGGHGWRLYRCGDANVRCDCRIGRNPPGSPSAL